MLQDFREQAATHREALERVHKKYGDQAQILSHRSVRTGGILGLFGRDEIEVYGVLKAASKFTQPAPTIGSLEDEKKKILEKTTGLSASKVIDAARNTEMIEKIFSEMQNLKKEFALGREHQAMTDDEHPSLKRARQLLYHNDFLTTQINEVLDIVRAEFTLAELDDWAKVQTRISKAIGEGLRIFRKPREAGLRIIVLVGPTGVGKTTTIAKIAAQYKCGIGGEKPASVRIITIDNYRIGARQQIETYGDIMSVPVSSAETPEELKKTIAMYNDCDVILVDTIGKSPRDVINLAHMQKLLSAIGPNAEVHLALPATMKATDMINTMRQFEIFNYRAIVLTKLDETATIGHILSVLNEKQKSLSFITVGQRVPQDIEIADRNYLLSMLEGFNVKRVILDNERPSSPSEQLRLSV